MSAAAPLSAEPFARLVAGAFAQADLPPPPAAADYLLTVSGRRLQLRLVGEDAMAVSAMVRAAADAADCDALAPAVARFNAFHLFAGGYRLLREAQAGDLYVEQGLAVSRFDPGALVRHLADFAERAGACARWCAAEAARAAGDDEAEAPR